MKKAIIFDIGGTLMDTNYNLFYYLENLIKKYNPNSDITQNIIEKTFIKIKNIYGKGKFQNIKKILQKVSKELNISKNINFEKIYSDLYLNEIYIFDNVKDILKKLQKNNFEIIAISDADSDILIPQLKKLGIYNFFSKIVISSDIKEYKPGNKIIKEVNNYLLSYKEIFYVGDSSVDIILAKKLGAKSILINNMKYKKNYSQNFTIKNIKELNDIIF